MDFSTAITWPVIAGTVLALSPVTSYLDTLISIHRRKSSAGFSLDVCAIMLISSICKVYFYFGRPYELSLFIQALIMIATQIVLLKLALQHRPRQWLHGPLDKDPSTSSTLVNKTPLAKFLLGNSILDNHTAESMRPFAFWEWEAEAPYWTFLVRLSAFLGILQVFLGRWSFYVESIGLIGLLIEAVLPLPQILTIASRGSVDGFRPSLLVSWLGGDISKLIFLVTSANVAPQFIVCACIQGCLDAFVGFQYFMYTTGRWKTSAQDQVRVSRQRAQSLKLQGVPTS